MTIPKVGSKWLHYKGGLYLVVGHARREDDSRLLVIYRNMQAAQGEYPWARLAEDWASWIDDKGQWKQRYILVEDAPT